MQERDCSRFDPSGANPVQVATPETLRRHAGGMKKPRYSRNPAHARRRLAAVRAQIESWRAVDCAGDWRKAADKARALTSLEAQEARWLAVLAPPPLSYFRYPF
jgi:hypothetical protein